MKFIFLALLALVVGFWWLSRHPLRRTRGGATAAARPQRPGHPRSVGNSRNPWRAVSIRPGPNSCNSVTNLGNQRFLAAEAPVTPVAGCKSRRCECKYIHYQDRRGDDPDRRSMAPPLADVSERRANQGRREEDRAL